MVLKILNQIIFFMFIFIIQIFKVLAKNIFCKLFSNLNFFPFSLLLKFFPSVFDPFLMSRINYYLFFKNIFSIMIMNRIIEDFENQANMWIFIFLKFENRLQFFTNTNFENFKLMNFLRCWKSSFVIHNLFKSKNFKPLFCFRFWRF